MEVKQSFTDATQLDPLPQQMYGKYSGNANCIETTWNISYKILQILFIT